MKRISILLLILSVLARADSPPSNISWIFDSSGNVLNSTTGALNVYQTNAVSNTVNQGTPNTPSNAWPIYLCNSAGTHCLAVNNDGSINVDATVSGSVTVANPSVNYSLETGGNLAAILSKLNATIAVTQSTSPWVVSGSGNFTVIQPTGSNLHVDVDNFPATQAVTQSGAWTTGRTWTLSSGTDSVAAVQSGAWNINNISGTVSLPTGASTSANQTNASQKTQVVDGSGNVWGPVATITGTNYQPVVLAASGVTGSAVPTRTIQVGGVGADSNLHTLSTDNSGQLNTNTNDGSGNKITSSTFNSFTGMSNVISGQNILTVTGTGSALNGDAIAATDVAAYQDIELQIVVTGTNTTTFQGSNDNFTTTFSVLCSAVTGANTNPVLTTAASGLFRCPITYRYFRARVTTFTSGSSAGTAIMTPLPGTNDMGQRSVSATQQGAWTVSTNPGAQTFSTQVASAARTTSGSSAITQGAPNNQAVFNLQVTAVSGTNPTLDLVFQESYDNGTTWVDQWHWERVTATGQFATPNLVMDTAKFRFVWTIGGATPSFTFSVTSNQGTQVGQVIKRFFDRTINLNSGGSSTASFFTDGCKNYQFTLNDSACSGFPVLTLYQSEDGTNFAATNSVLTTSAAGTFVTSPMAATAGHWSEVQVTSAGTGCTLGYVALRCTQY